MFAAKIAKSQAKDAASFAQGRLLRRSLDHDPDVGRRLLEETKGEEALRHSEPMQRVPESTDPRGDALPPRADARSLLGRAAGGRWSWVSDSI